MKPELYYFPASTCGLKVRLALEEKRVGWTARILDRDAGDLNTPQYRALNPNGVVPTMVHGDRVLIESSVIMHYVDEVFDGPSLMPADPYLRSRVRMWMKRADETLLPAAGVLTYAMVVRDKIRAMGSARRQAYYDAIPDPVRRARRIAVVEQGLDAPDVGPAAKALSRMARDLDAALSGGNWLSGPDWGLADAAIAPFALRMNEFGGLWLKDYSAVSDWWDRLRARTSWVNTAEQDQDHQRLGRMKTAGALSEPKLRGLAS